MIIRTILCTLALALSMSTADAAPKKKKRKAAKPTNSLCVSTGESTKKCSVSGDSAELHINISRAHPVIVTLDEEPEFASGDAYVSYKVTDKFVLFRLNGKLPKHHKLILQTETMTLTLYFHEVKKGADSQIHIRRTDRDQYFKLIEARVAETKKRLEQEYAAKLQALEESRERNVVRRVRSELLDQIYTGGSYVGKPGGEIRSRNDFLVLRATGVTRIGKERVLQLSIEERKGDTFPVGKIIASVEQGGVSRTLKIDSRCRRMSVAPGKVVSCTLSLGPIDKSKGLALVSVKITGADFARSVSLNGIDIR